MKNPLQGISKEKQQHLLLIGIVTLIVICAVYMFWISGQYDSWVHNREEIEKLIPQIEAAERSEKAEAQNETLRRELTVFIETQRVSMVTGDVLSWGLREITLAAEKHPNIKLLGFRAGQRLPHPRANGLQTYSVVTDIKGGFDDIGRFIAAIENQFPTSYVRTLNFSVGDGTTGGRQATIEVAFLIWPESGNIWITSPTKADPKEKR